MLFAALDHLVADELDERSATPQSNEGGAVTAWAILRAARSSHLSLATITSPPAEGDPGDVETCQISKQQEQSEQTTRQEEATSVDASRCG